MGLKWLLSPTIGPPSPRDMWWLVNPNWAHIHFPRKSGACINLLIYYWSEYSSCLLNGQMYIICFFETKGQEAHQTGHVLSCHLSRLLSMEWLSHFGARISIFVKHMMCLWCVFFEPDQTTYYQWLPSWRVCLHRNLINNFNHIGIFLFKKNSYIPML